MSTVDGRPGSAPGAEVEGIVYEDRPEGPIAAAIIAGGVGALAMGVVTTLSEASSAVSKALNWKASVGPLSGKTIITVLVWLLAWAVLHVIYRGRPYETKRALTIALVMIGLGVLGTFPLFFQLFGD